MAIQFNPNALSMFSSVNFGNDDAIANLGGENNLVQKNELGTFLLKPFRSGETEKRNNAVRTELLKALGQAFDLHGVTEQDGRTTFSDEFMRRLSDILGPAFKRGVMLFNRLVAGDFEGLHKNDAPRMLEMVRDQLASLREKYGDNPPADDRPRVSLQLPGGQS